MMEYISNEHGRSKLNYMEFRFKGGSPKLHSILDMQILDNNNGKLSSPLMDFFVHGFKIILRLVSSIASLLKKIVNGSSVIPAMVNFFEHHSTLQEVKNKPLLFPICNFGY
jgi:hypothetical protein